MSNDHSSRPDPHSFEATVARELGNISKHLQEIEQHLSDMVGKLDQGQPRR